MPVFSSGKTPETSVLSAFAANERLTVKSCSRHDTIADVTNTRDTIYIVLSGTVCISEINESGKKNILEFFGVGDIITEDCFPRTGRSSYFCLFAHSACNIASVSVTDFDRLLKKEDPAAEILKASRNRIPKRILTHAAILQQRTLSDKLLTFFGMMKNRTGTASFTVPISYTDLADYLAVDRSAMMRELKKLNDNGIIKSEKLNITFPDPS